MSDVVSVTTATGMLYTTSDEAIDSTPFRPSAKISVQTIELEYPFDPHAPVESAAAAVAGMAPAATVHLHDGRTLELFDVVTVERAAPPAGPRAAE